MIYNIYTIHTISNILNKLGIQLKLKLTILNAVNLNASLINFR